MEKLEITQQEAITLYRNANELGKKILEDKFGKENLVSNIMDKIKNGWEDVCKIKGIDSVNSLRYPDPQNDEEKYDNAAFRLRVAAEVLREGIVLSHYNKKQEKWWPWFTATASGFGFSGSNFDNSNTTASVGSRLCVDTQLKSDFLAEVFKSDWEIFYTK
jgi:hypothetical protein